MTTLTHPAVAALREVMAEWRDGYGLRCVEQVRTALTASAAYDEAVGECVETLREISRQYENIDVNHEDFRVWANRVSATALAKIAKLGER